MNIQEYKEEIKRQRKLNEIFVNSTIMKNKFNDYMQNLHKSNIPILEKQQITNVLIPKIKNYSTKIYNFRRMNSHY